MLRGSNLFDQTEQVIFSRIVSIIWSRNVRCQTRPGVSRASGFCDGIHREIPCVAAADGDATDLSDGQASTHW